MSKSISDYIDQKYIVPDQDFSSDEDYSGDWTEEEKLAAFKRILKRLGMLEKWESSNQ